MVCTVWLDNVVISKLMYKFIDLTCRSVHGGLLAKGSGVEKKYFTWPDRADTQADMRYVFLLYMFSVQSRR